MAGEEGTGTSGDHRGLSVTDVVKRYAGVPALAGVSVALLPGEIVGLVGHNGAGKSTLLKVLAGAIRPDEGVQRIDGRPVTLTSPAQALQAGISSVYQELSLLPNLTITQNVFLGRERRGRLGLARAAMRAEAQDLVSRFGVTVDVDRPLGDYPVATRQLLEIAVATHRDARYLLLDEPTTSLEGEQVNRLLELLATLARDRGLGILLVDHKLDELYRVADRIVALVDGRVRIDAVAREVPRADVVRAIAGDEAAGVPDGGATAAAATPGAPAPSTRSPGERPVLRVRDLHSAVLDGVSLDAYAGRVLGLYGLVGSGRTEFLRSLVGLEAVTGGSIELDGTPFRPAHPAHAQRQGVVYLTEERKVDGIVPQLDPVTNVALPVLHRYTRFGVLDRRAMTRDSVALLDRLSVRGDRRAPVVGLSGGNQQKVLLARALAQRPRLLLLDEPTKGVDIGVKAQLHRIVRDLAAEQGHAVVVVSSEEDEILELADDVAVFRARRCDGDVQPAAGLTVRDLRSAAWSGP